MPESAATVLLVLAVWSVVSIIWLFCLTQQVFRVESDSTSVWNSLNMLNNVTVPLNNTRFAEIDRQLADLRAYKEHLKRHLNPLGFDSDKEYDDA